MMSDDMRLQSGKARRVTVVSTGWYGGCNFEVTLDSGGRDKVTISFVNLLATASKEEGTDMKVRDTFLFQEEDSNDEEENSREKQRLEIEVCKCVHIN
jgi:hypothetical protein